MFEKERTMAEIEAKYVQTVTRIIGRDKENELSSIVEIIEENRLRRESNVQSANLYFDRRSQLAQRIVDLFKGGKK